MEIRAMGFVLCRNRPYIGVLQSGCNLGRAPPSCLSRRLVGPTHFFPIQQQTGKELNKSLVGPTLCMEPLFSVPAKSYRGGDHDDDDGWLYHSLTPQ